MVICIPSRSHEQIQIHSLTYNLIVKHHTEKNRFQINGFVGKIAKQKKCIQIRRLLLPNGARSSSSREEKIQKFRKTNGTTKLTSVTAHARSLFRSPRHLSTSPRPQTLNPRRQTLEQVPSFSTEGRKNRYIRTKELQRDREETNNLRHQETPATRPS